MSGTEEWLDTESANVVDLYNGDEYTAFIGPHGGDWVYRIDSADCVPGGFATWAQTMHDGYVMSHPRVNVYDPAIGPVVATHTRAGRMFVTVGTAGRNTATGAAAIFLGD